MAEMPKLTEVQLSVIKAKIKESDFSILFTVTKTDGEESTIECDLLVQVRQLPLDVLVRTVAAQCAHWMINYGIPPNEFMTVFNQTFAERVQQILIEDAGGQGSNG